MEFLLVLFMSFFGLGGYFSTPVPPSTQPTPVITQETTDKYPTDRVSSSGKGDLIIVFEDLDLRTTKEK